MTPPFVGLSSKARGEAAHQGSKHEMGAKSYLRPTEDYTIKKHLLGCVGKELPGGYGSYGLVLASVCIQQAQVQRTSNCLSTIFSNVHVEKNIWLTNSTHGQLKLISQLQSQVTGVI